MRYGLRAAFSDRVIFLPDEYLAKNVARESGKEIIIPTRGKNGHLNGGINGMMQSNIDLVSPADFQMVGWHGRCEVHEKFTVSDIQSVRAQFPDVVIVSHPECSPEVVAASDFAGSTQAMINFVEQSNAPRYLVLTECSMGDNIAAANPDKEMLRLCSVRCPHMNQITLEDTLESLQKEQYEIVIDEDVRRRALRSVERMLQIGKED